MHTPASSQRVLLLRWILPYCEYVLDLQLNRSSADFVQIYSLTQPLPEDALTCCHFWRRSSLLPYLTTFQPALVSQTIFQPGFETVFFRWPCFCRLIHQLATRTRHTKLSLLKQAQSRVLSLRLRGFVPVLRRSLPACPTKQPSFQSWDDLDLLVNQTTIVTVLRGSWLACPTWYQFKQSSTRCWNEQISSRVFCLWTHHFCKIKLTFR